MILVCTHFTRRYHLFVAFCLPFDGSAPVSGCKVNNQSIQVEMRDNNRESEI